MQIKKSLTTSTGAAYSYGDAIGSLMTLTDSNLIPPSEWKLNSVLVKDYSGRNPAGQCIFFDSYPTNTSITDNLRLDIPQQNDGDKICGMVSLMSTAYVNVSGVAMGVMSAADQSIKGNPLYAVLRGYTAAAFASTSAVDLVFNFGK